MQKKSSVPVSRPCFALACILALLCFSIPLQSQTLWRQSSGRTTGDTLSLRGHFAVYELNFGAFNSVLKTAPSESRKANTNDAVLSLPKPTGEVLEFVFTETQLFSSTDTLSAQIKTYTGRSTDGSAVVHLTVYQKSISGIALQNGYTWFINAAQKAADNGSAITVEVYDNAGRPFKNPVPKCDADGQRLNQLNISGRVNGRGATLRTPSVSSTLKIYRLAMAGTADYVTYFGSQSAAIANTAAIVNNLNAIYEQELGVRFTLVTNNSLMYTDGAMDPFTNSAASPCSELDLSKDNFVAVLGNGNYDLGVTLYGQNFGGCAYVGATCAATYKGGAVGGYDYPTPTSYILDVAAHEIGHLFNAGHTHNATGTGCAITTSSAWEPGGGSTIMAYVNCSPSFTSYNTQMYFHGGNLGQMRGYIAASGGCYIAGAANTTPLLTAPTDNTFYIPISTPFKLYAEAADAEDPNTLTYTFEQMDLGTGSAATPSPTSTSGPLIRSFEPSSKSYRYIPRMDSIVAGITPIFESLPSVARNLTFWATVRDNHPGGGGQSVDTINITTAGSTPFRVTSQAAITTLTAGSTVNVTWDAAGTTAAPFNVSNVQILFAGDGLNYNTVLAASTPNDGSQAVTIPNIITGNGRVMVAAIGNLFFDINDANITVQTPCGDVQRNQIYPETKLTAVQGSATLQLSQTPAFGIGSNGFDGEITAADPSGILGFRTSATDASCQQGSGFNGRYDLFNFYTLTPGNYSISRATGTLSGYHFYTLHGTGGYNAGSVCNNFLYSNTYFNGGSVSFTGGFDYTLAAGNTYALAFEVYGNSTYGTYRMNVSGPGPVFTEYKSVGNSYSYVVVDNSENVVAITTTVPDLRSYAPGTYYVYGVSHSSAVNLTSYQGQTLSALLYGNFSSGGCVSISNNRREVTIRSNATLPLTYVQLSAKAEGTAARLRWTVSDEAEAAGCTVEHSTDGGLTFVPIATLATGQNRVAAAQYSYQHVMPVGGKNVYRIRQTARSGGWLYSNTATVDFDNRPYVTVTPNPTTGLVTVNSFRQQGFVPFTVRLFDNSGKLVKQVLVNRSSYALDLSGLAAGVYTIVSSSGFTQKLIKN